MGSSCSVVKPTFFYFADKDWTEPRDCETIARTSLLDGDLLIKNSMNAFLRKRCISQYEYPGITIGTITKVV